MKYFLLAAPVVALVAACSGGADKLQPGQWDITFKATDIEGLPPEMAAAAKAQLASQTKTDSQCLTQEEADNMAGKMTSGMGSGNCTFSKQTFAGGAIDVAGTCPSPMGSGNAELAVTGSFTGTTMDAKMTTSMPGPTGGQVKISGEMTGRRTGDCAAGAK